MIAIILQTFVCATWFSQPLSLPPGREVAVGKPVLDGGSSSVVEVRGMLEDFF